MKVFYQHSKHFFNTLITFIIIVLPSCERDVFHSGQPGNFFFSTDTVMFDTVFTGLGTPTYKLLIKNPNDFNLLIDSLYLANPHKPGFIVNANGNSSFQGKLTIDKKDSLYIFIQAFLPENQETAPFVNEDSLIFVSGNSVKKVRLIAFGQNTIHFRESTIQTQDWFAGKPFLIYGTLTISEGHKLTVHEGVKVFMHRNARILVKGTININGTFNSPVRFKGDRLEKDYDTIPGQWGGLIITGTGQKHNIQHAIIRNATTGIVFGDYTNPATVEANVANTVVANTAYSAIIAYQANITAQNLVLVNSGNTTLSLYGGNYRFIHSTFANYGARYVARSVDSRTLLLANYIEFTNSENKQETLLKDLTKAEFGNTIVYGNTLNEIKIQKKDGNTFAANFENCIIKISDTGLITGAGNIFNKSPLFIRPENENFRIDSLSPAKNAGKIALGNEVPFDLENQPRTTDLAPDVGAYERKEKQ